MSISAYYMMQPKNCCQRAALSKNQKICAFFLRSPHSLSLTFAKHLIGMDISWLGSKVAFLSTDQNVQFLRAGRQSSANIEVAPIILSRAKSHGKRRNSLPILRASRVEHGDGEERDSMIRPNNTMLTTLQEAFLLAIIKKERKRERGK